MFNVFRKAKKLKIKHQTLDITGDFIKYYFYGVKDLEARLEWVRNKREENGDSKSIK